jgi:hypothetical protein
VAAGPQDGAAALLASAVPGSAASSAHRRAADWRRDLSAAVAAARAEEEAPLGTAPAPWKHAADLPPLTQMAAPASPSSMGSRLLDSLLADELALLRLTQPKGAVLVLDSALRDAVAAGSAAAAPGAPPPPPPGAPVLSSNWQAHAAAWLRGVYDPNWHASLFDLWFDLWPQLGAAHVAAGTAPTRPRLLLSGSEEVASAVQLAARSVASGLSGAADDSNDDAPPPPPHACPPHAARRAAAAAALLDAAYGFAAACADSPDFGVRAALAISALDCLDDHDVLPAGLAARLPPRLVLRVLSPLARRFQPPWVVDEWAEAVAAALPRQQPAPGVPRRWWALVERLEGAQVSWREGEGVAVGLRACAWVGFSWRCAAAGVLGSFHDCGRAPHGAATASQGLKMGVWACGVPGR